MNISAISVSRFGVYDECERKYLYQYHLKLPTEDKPYFLFGKVVHKVAEEYVRRKGLRPINDIAGDVLSGAIPYEENVTEKPHFDFPARQRFDVIVRNVKRFCDQVGFDGECEWPFEMDLEPGKNRIVRGVIDRLVIRGDSAFIIDYKTTKPGPYRKNPDTIRGDLQLRTYAKVVQREFGIKPENMTAALFYVDDAVIVPTRFNQEGVDQAAETLRAAHQKIEERDPDRVHGRVGQHCRRCDFCELCPLAKMANIRPWAPR